MSGDRRYGEGADFAWQWRPRIAFLLVAYGFGLRDRLMHQQQN